MFGIDNNGRLTISDSRGTVRWSNIKYYLSIGQNLKKNEIFKDPYRDVFLMVQGDGNMIVFEGYGRNDPNKRSLWSTGPAGQSGYYFLKCQNDGNLVVQYGAKEGDGPNVWSSGSRASIEASLSFDDQLRLIIRQVDGTIVWTAE